MYNLITQNNKNSQNFKTFLLKLNLTNSEKF